MPPPFWARQTSAIARVRSKKAAAALTALEAATGAEDAVFEATTRFLLDHGAPVDGLGLQAHFNGRPNAPENILAVLDRYERQFHLPVRMTEFDVWTRDDELQADIAAPGAHGPADSDLIAWTAWPR